MLLPGTTSWAAHVPRRRVLAFGADALARPFAGERTQAGEAVAHLGVNDPFGCGFRHMAHEGDLLHPKRRISGRQPN